MSLRDEPWHFLTCSRLRQEQSRRHNAVVDAIARVAWLVGAQVRKEVEGLDPLSRQRPDLHIVFPGRVLLTDVVVSHSLTLSRTAQHRSTTAIKQAQKGKKANVASRLGAELLNVSVDTCGGLASDAVKLVRAIAEEGERWSAGDMEQRQHRAATAGRHRSCCAARQCADHADGLHPSEWCADRWNASTSRSTGSGRGGARDCRTRSGGGVGVVVEPVWWCDCEMVVDLFGL